MKNAQAIPTTHKHAIDLAAVPVGTFVVEEITLTHGKHTTKKRYFAPGAFEHCQVLAQHFAYSDRRSDKWTSATVSETEFFTICDEKSITWKVRQVIARKPKSKNA